ncbi:MAG: hypothetical protein ACI9P8_000775 [Bacteroidia bacterium]|jgi:hypothetical protein
MCQAISGVDIATVPALAAAMARLVNHIIAIRSLNTVQEMSTKGKTEDKAQRKVSLADLGYGVAASTHAYATVHENNHLYQRVNFTHINGAKPNA